MKKYMMAAALAALSSLSQADDVGRHMTLRERIQTDTAQVDHVARIGQYDYEVYVDRSVSPVEVAAIITDESRLRQGKYTDPVSFIEDLKRHKKLVVGYMNSLRGTQSFEQEQEQDLISTATLTRNAAGK